MARAVLCRRVTVEAMWCVWCSLWGLVVCACVCACVCVSVFLCGASCAVACLLVACAHQPLSSPEGKQLTPRDRALLTVGEDLLLDA